MHSDELPMQKQLGIHSAHKRSLFSSSLNHLFVQISQFWWVFKTQSDIRLYSIILDIWLVVIFQLGVLHLGSVDVLGIMTVFWWGWGWG